MKQTDLIMYAPEGVTDPATWVELVATHVMGLDKQGKPRPLADFALFLHAAQRMGLDPLARQIYAIYRKDNATGKERMSIQVGIDGMRTIAQRTGQYGGQDDARFDPEDESTHDPKKATVTVYRVNQITGERMGTTKSARWNEYAPYNLDWSPMWKKMPYTMLAKCAEALALRAAFPAELSGVYANEEMDQAGPGDRQELSASREISGTALVLDDATVDRLVEDGKAAATRVIENLVHPGDDSEVYEHGDAPEIERLEKQLQDEPEPRCPNCGGEMWDNHARKADGRMAPNAPDYKCKNKECVDAYDKTTHPSLYWPGQWPPKIKPSKEQLDAFLELAKGIWTGRGAKASFLSWFHEHYPDVNTKGAASASDHFLLLTPEQAAAAIQAASETLAKLTALAEEQRNQAEIDQTK